MIIGIFSFVLVVLIVAIIALLMRVKHLSKEIDGLREIVEHHRIKLQILDFYDLSEHEDRLYQLEEALELKEYFDH